MCFHYLLLTSVGFTGSCLLRGYILNALSGQKFYVSTQEPYSCHACKNSSIWQDPYYITINNNPKLISKCFNIHCFICFCEIGNEIFIFQIWIENFRNSMSLAWHHTAS